MLLILLCVAIVNNFIMYYKCYLNNTTNDPFVPPSVGKYQISVYYDKHMYPEDGLMEQIKPFLTPFKDKYFGKYVVTYGRPTRLEYEQISKLSSIPSE